MGIRDRPTAPRSLWQNGHTERLIGSIRRECLDHVVVFGERHLRHLLLSYMAYYNGARTHLSLNKDAPVPRAHSSESNSRRVTPPICSDLISDMDSGDMFTAVTRAGFNPTDRSGFLGPAATDGASRREGAFGLAPPFLGAVLSKFWVFSTERVGMIWAPY